MKKIIFSLLFIVFTIILSFLSASKETVRAAVYPTIIKATFINNMVIPTTILYWITHENSEFITGINSGAKYLYLKSGESADILAQDYIGYAPPYNLTFSSDNSNYSDYRILAPISSIANSSGKYTVDFGITTYPFPTSLKSCNETYTHATYECKQPSTCTGVSRSAVGTTCVNAFTNGVCCGPAISGPSGYVLCSYERENCSFNGTTSVAFGANGKFNYGNYTNNVLCTVSNFGDPAIGVTKACFYKSASSPTATPIPGGGACWTPSWQGGSMNNMPEGGDVTLQPGAAFTMTCNYGTSGVSCIAPSQTGCTFTGFKTDGAAGFNCTAPITPGTYPISCNLAGPASACTPKLCREPTTADNHQIGILTVPTPASTTGVVMGYKVKMPGNNGTDPTISGQTVTLDNGAKSTTNNPYPDVNNLMAWSMTAGSHTVSVPNLTGYTIGYTLCTNSTACHSEPLSGNSSYRQGTSATFNVNGGDSVDLWWHYTPSTVAPTPAPKDPPCKVPASLGGGANDWYGDVDGDGKISNNDSIQILRHIASLPTTPAFGSLQIEKADVNGQPNTQSISSGITSSDSLMILSYLAGTSGVTTFTACPAPTASPTVTPTPPVGNTCTNGTVSGRIFVDINPENGVFDSAAEQGFDLIGQPILYNNNGGLSISKDISAGNGLYQFTASTNTNGYWLRFTAPTGYRITTPRDASAEWEVSPRADGRWQADYSALKLPPCNQTYDFGITTQPATPTPTTAPLPDCNGGGSCTTCQSNQSNTCDGRGSQTCTYTTYNGDARCNTVSSPVTCNTAPPNCSSNYTCDASKQCVINPSPTLTPTTAPTATPTIPVGTTVTPTPTSIPGATLTPTPITGVSITPTPTLAPHNTAIALNIGLDSIGSVGDSTNPDPSASTKNPKRPTRTVTVELYNSSESLVSSFNGTVQYNSTTGRFTGTVALGQTAGGNYIVKVKSLGYLRRRLPGITTLVAGQTYNANQVNLVTGDVNGDNHMDIADYNILNDCIFAPAATHGTVCGQNPDYAVISDLNDDGIKNILDYSLFVRELIVRDGD